MISSKRLLVFTSIMTLTVMGTVVECEKEVEVGVLREAGEGTIVEILLIQNIQIIVAMERLIICLMFLEMLGLIRMVTKQLIQSEIFQQTEIVTPICSPQRKLPDWMGFQ